MYIIPLSHLPNISSLEQNQNAAAIKPQQNAIPVFGDMLQDALENVQKTQQISQQDSYNLALGKTDDLHTMQINSMKASAAIELTAGLTSRAITAYKEILQTQI